VPKAPVMISFPLTNPQLVVEANPSGGRAFLHTQGRNPSWCYDPLLCGPFGSLREGTESGGFLVGVGAVRKTPRWGRETAIAESLGDWSAVYKPVGRRLRSATP
jgi:hypothetical protein